MNVMFRSLAFITAVVIAALIAFNVWLSKTISSRSDERNITINSINLELSEILSEHPEDPSELISEKLPEWRRIYGADVPDKIEFIPIKADAKQFISSSDSDTSVCTVRNGNDELLGVVLYTCKNSYYLKIRIVFCCVIIAFWMLICGVLLYIHFRILAPFKKLADYPAHIAKIPTAEKLPESRNKYFGKFIWGMNMLTDVLQTERRENEKLEYQRQTLIASIAHGVKTPVTNISLYADAIETGLYSDHVDIAQKIRNNTKKIEALTAELIGTASESVNAYIPEISKFYLRELCELTLSEYAGRMKISMIPFDVSCSGDPMIESDKYGLFRIISQLIENAVKYGNGQGISVAMRRQDDGTSISVRNKGQLLPESELPFVFGSFWRGSNSRNTEGSGIGLFISQKIAAALGGSVYVRRLPETEEMEFTIFINA